MDGEAALEDANRLAECKCLKSIHYLRLDIRLGGAKPTFPDNKLIVGTGGMGQGVAWLR